MNIIKHLVWGESLHYTLYIIVEYTCIYCAHSVRSTTNSKVYVQQL